MKGVENLILITDCFDYADTDGNSDVNRNKYGELCGSLLTMEKTCRNIIYHTGVSMVDAFNMASRNPAKAIGLIDKIGSVAKGKVADLVIVDNDTFISFKDLFINQCNKCNYECMTINKCKYRHDDVYNLLNNSIMYNKIIFVVPMYCGNPSSLYFTLIERMQDYFNNNESNYPLFVNKLHIIGIYGSSEETPLFIPLISSILDNIDKSILALDISFPSI